MIPSVTVPTYKMILPVSKDEFEFRPFLVKEEKILLMAKETENVKEAFLALNEVINKCTFEKMKSSNYSVADTEYAFLQIRGKSIGETLDLNLICPNKECKKSTITTVHVEDFVLDREIDNQHNTISVGGIKVIMKYPALEQVGEIIDNFTEDTVISIIAKSIDSMYNDEEKIVIDESNIEDVIEFINNLTIQDFSKFKEFFNNVPKLRKKITLDCNHCGEQNSFEVDGITSFFV